MERELGLYNLSEDIRNIDKPTSTFQERLDDIMGDDVEIERKMLHACYSMIASCRNRLGIGQCK